MKFKLGDLTKVRGVAQIPLIIGLLLMAVAIPIATKLSQQSAENRGKATYCSTGSCNLNSCYQGNSSACCCSGYTCTNYQCVFQGTSSPTPRPTNTPVPTNCTSCGAAGSCSIPYNTSQCVGSYRCTCASTTGGTASCTLCTHGCANNTCLPAPTATGTPPAQKWYKMSCNTSNGSWNCSQASWGTYSSEYACQTASGCDVPTSTPVPTSPPACSGLNATGDDSLNCCSPLAKCYVSTGMYQCKTSCTSPTGPVPTTDPTIRCTISGVGTTYFYTPGTMVCNTDGTYRTCLTSGGWSPTTSCPSGTCVNGQCTSLNCSQYHTSEYQCLAAGCRWPAYGHCIAPGESLCSLNGVYYELGDSMCNADGVNKRTCVTGGTWSSWQSCAPGVCNNGECVPSSSTPTPTSGNVSSTPIPTRVPTGVVCATQGSDPRCAGRIPGYSPCGGTGTECVKYSNNVCGCEMIGLSPSPTRVSTITSTPRPTNMLTGLPTNPPTLYCYCDGNCGLGDCIWSATATGNYGRRCDNTWCQGIPSPTPTPRLFCYCDGNCGLGDCAWLPSASGNYGRRCDAEWCQGIPSPTSGPIATRTPTPTIAIPVSPTVIPNITVMPTIPVTPVPTSTGAPPPPPTGNPPPPSCGYNSLQAMVQLDSSNDWQTQLTVNNGDSVNLGCMYDGSGQLASGVRLVARYSDMTDTNFDTNVNPVTGWVAPKNGNYTIFCEHMDGSLCPGLVSSTNATLSVGGACKECPNDFHCYGPDEQHLSSGYAWFATGYVLEGYAAQVPDDYCTDSGLTKPQWLGKGMGDANCDGKLDVADTSIWRREYADISQGDKVVRSDWEADFTGPQGVCDGIVDLGDYSLWRANFTKYFQGQ